MSDVKITSAGDLTRSLSGAIQSHPLPAALIGMGLVWLFGGGKSMLGVGGGASSTRGASDVTSSGGSNNGRSPNGGSKAGVFAAAQGNIAELLNQQPLMLGAIGLGVGAAMAATLPSTSLEADLLGQTSADLQARTRELSGEMTERVADLADGAATAIATEVRAQGLTPEDLKESAREASRKIQNVVSQSAEQLRSRSSM